MRAVVKRSKDGGQDTDAGPNFEITHSCVERLGSLESG